MARRVVKMFNVDRWEIYSRQLANRNPQQLAMVSAGFMRNMTPKQIRRCKKKAGRNKDFSLGSPQPREEIVNACGKCGVETNGYTVDLNSYLCYICDWDFNTWCVERERWQRIHGRQFTYAEFLEGK